MTTRSDFYELLIPVVASALPDLIQAHTKPDHPDSIALTDRAWDTVRAAYMADTADEPADPYSVASLDAAESAFQILQATAASLEQVGTE